MISMYHLNRMLVVRPPNAGEVVEYDDLIADHEQAIIDGLIHSDETPLDIEGQPS